MTTILMLVMLVVSTVVFWVPIGFFVLFGVNENIYSLNETYHSQIALFILLFHALNSFLVYKTVKAKKRKLWLAAVIFIWSAGFLGMMRVHFPVSGG